MKTTEFGLGGTIFTIDSLIEKYNSNFSEIRKYLSKYATEYPTRVIKPTLKQNPTSADALAFAEALKAWEFDKQLYDKQYHMYQDDQNIIQQIMNEVIKELSGFYSSVPEKYQSKVFSMVSTKKDCDSDSYCLLTDLVQIFE